MGAHAAGVGRGAVVTSWRKQMTGDELVALLRDGASLENRRESYETRYGLDQLEAFQIGEARTDARRAWKWIQYQRLIWRYYNSGLVTVSEDGTRTPWSLDRLGSEAP